MIKNRYTTSAMLLFILFLSGCAEQEMDSPIHGDSFTIEVSDGGFLSADAGVTTRAVEDGFKTVFTSGDRLGLIVTDGGSQLVIDNKAFTFDGTKWTDAGGSQNITYDASYRYLVYYPYSETMNGKKTEDEIKNAFTPKADQRNYADYTASDLMIGTGGMFNTAGNILRMELKHVRTMLILAPKYTYEWKGQTYNWVPDNFSEGGLVIGDNVYVPWQSGTNETRLLLSVSELSSGSIRYFYTQGGQKKTGTAVISGGQQGKYQWIVPETSVYTLAPGAVYYADGTLLPSAAGYTGSTPIGIVYSTDVSRISTAAKQALKEKGVDTPHGLVMALTNASDGCRWGEYGKDENSGGADGEPFKADTDKLYKMYDNVDGYGETHWIIDTYGRSGNTALQNTYTAFYHASRYGTAESSTEKYAAPSNTTGWFIPSMGQWWDILSNLGSVNLTGYQSSQENSKYIDGAGRIAVDNMNRYLEKISGATQFSTGTYFWSSSEYDGYRACYVNFDSRGSLDLGWRIKASSSRVLCSFAF